MTACRSPLIFGPRTNCRLSRITHARPRSRSRAWPPAQREWPDLIPPDDGEYAKLLGYALQVASTLIGKSQPRPRYEITDGARDKNLSAASLGRDPGRDMNGNACYVVIIQLDLARVKAAPDLYAERAYPLDDGRRATNGACGSVERSEEAVPEPLDHLPPHSGKLPPHEVVVLLQQGTPAAITEVGGSLR